MNNIKVEYVAIHDLKPATYNPRKISNEALDQLKESIERFAVIDPLIVNGAPNRKNVVIGGHMRLRAAKALRHTSIPVVYVSIPDEKKEKELNLRLNKNTGEWDFEKLKSFEFGSLLDVGFDTDELNSIWTQHMEAEEEGFDVETELAEIKEPITRYGDLIQLGKHRLICGDCTKPDLLKRLFGNKQASMIYSDPPYNINLDYNKGIGGKKSYGGNVKDDRSYSEYREFIKHSLESALSVTHKDAHIFYWSDQTYIGLIQELYRSLGIQNKRVCLWIKNGQNPTPSVAFNKCYEPCTYGVRGKPYIAKAVSDLNEVMNKEVGTGNQSLDDISDIWIEKRLCGKEYEHATSKPPKLHEKAIRRCTKPNDIILDSFSGSASTLIAAEQLGRRVYAVELEPLFCDLAIKRFEQLTGIKAIIEHGKET